MASLKITAAQKKLLTATELTPLKKALEPHTDVARLIRDLRALRAYRQKQRDNLGKQVRAIKVGAQQTRALEANARTHQLEFFPFTRCACSLRALQVSGSIHGSRAFRSPGPFGPGDFFASCLAEKRSCLRVR